MTARANWRDAAACRDADADLFFPIGTTGPALRQIGEAKRVCRTCPAQAQCLAWALDNRVVDGVWEVPPGKSGALCGACPEE
jgi:WhiB family redox-sensing transcriptional regulator